MKAIGSVTNMQSGPDINDLIRQAQAQAQTQATLTKASTPDAINRSAAFNVLELDLSSSVFPDVPPGYALYYLREGSHPAGRVTIKGAGAWENMAPGEFFSGYFDGLKLVRGSRSVTSGRARLLVVQSPGVVTGMIPETNAAGNLGGGLVGPSGATTQTRNSAAGNVPALITDGVDVSGCRGFRVTLASINAASTLSGAGTVRIWRASTRNPIGSGWFRTSIDFDADVSGVQYLQFPDQVLAVPEGRVYAEAVSVTNSAGDLYVAIETWG